MHTIAGGATAKPFITYHNALDMNLYLRIATELHLKRLIIGGMDKVYELGRIFRNEGISTKHNPEFTTVEIYQAQADYEDMMRLMEDLVSTVAMKILGTHIVTFAGHELDLTPPWPRLTMIDAIKKYANLDFNAIKTTAEAQAAVRQKGLTVKANATRGEIINECFEEFVEKHLIQPIFIKDYPIEVSPWQKKSRRCKFDL